MVLIYYYLFSIYEVSYVMFRVIQGVWQQSDLWNSFCDVHYFNFFLINIIALHYNKNI